MEIEFSNTVNLWNDTHTVPFRIFILNTPPSLDAPIYYLGTNHYEKWVQRSFTNLWNEFHTASVEIFNFVHPPPHWYHNTWMRSESLARLNLAILRIHRKIHVLCFLESSFWSPLPRSHNLQFGDKELTEMRSVILCIDETISTPHFLKCLGSCLLLGTTIWNLHPNQFQTQILWLLYSSSRYFDFTICDHESFKKYNKKIIFVIEKVQANTKFELWYLRTGVEKTPRMSRWRYVQKIYGWWLALLLFAKVGETKKITEKFTFSFIRSVLFYRILSLMRYPKG